MVQASPPKVEFSRLIPRSKVEDRQLGDEGRLRIEATTEERKALAERFDLLELDRLQAVLQLRPDAVGGTIRLVGELEAEVVQACVVTLEPVRSRIHERFGLLFSLTAPEPQDSGEVEVAAEEEDPPEPVGPAGIDVGEAVAQQLALALDPYPRAEGAALETAQWPGESDDTESEDGPFQELRSLKRRG